MWFGDIRNVSDVAIADLLYDASIIVNGTEAGEGALSNGTAYMDGSKANFDIWTIDYTTEVHPENAVGSTHYSGQSLLASWPTEAWNSWAWLNGSEFAGLSLVKIDFLYTGADKLSFNVMRHDGTAWRVSTYSDFIYNGTRYTTEEYVIEGKATWQSIYVVVADKDFAGPGTRLTFKDAAKTNELGYLEMWFGDIRNVSDVAIADLLD